MRVSSILSKCLLNPPREDIECNASLPVTAGEHIRVYGFPGHTVVA